MHFTEMTIDDVIDEINEFIASCESIDDPDERGALVESYSILAIAASALRDRVEIPQAQACALKNWISRSVAEKSLVGLSCEQALYEKLNDAMTVRERIIDDAWQAAVKRGEIHDIEGAEIIVSFRTQA